MNEQDIKAVRQPIPQMDKVYAVLDQIEADPEHWDQRDWSRPTSCGTAMCFAGWACKLDGLELMIEVSPEDLGASALLSDGRTIEHEAQNLLGLTGTEAYELFVRTLTRDEPLDFETREQERARHLHNVKVEVAKISARAKEQQAAFERVAKELIETVPELEDVLKPGYLCPESRDLVMKYLGGQDGGN